MSTGRSKLRSKNVLIVAILAFGVRSVILVTSSIAQASAQQQQQYHQRTIMRWSDEGIPQINDSVSLANKTSNFINENVRLQFIPAVQNAQGQVTNETVFDGHLDTVQGHLVYKFFVANTAKNQTEHLTVMDPGNGEVLCTMEGQPLGSFDQSSMHGHLGGGHDYGGWDGADLGKDYASENGNNAILR